MCTHRRDGLWTTDLLWHYLHDVKTPAPPVGSWYKTMDPSNELSNRHRVYEILVDEADQTFPLDQPAVEVSKIPWNQGNANLQETCEVATGKPHACGTIVKLFFQRYMGWGAKETSHAINAPRFDAAKWVIQHLEQKKPVRVALNGAHYIGIVGHRCIPTPLPPGPQTCSPNHEFLVVEPWAYGTTADQKSMVYAGAKTGYLQILRQEGSKWIYQKHKPTYVEGF